eukprot:TRINITY_DN771_c0_g1_i1.p1 TRINITY_DN771_c0_g1~~TRINITY_DN771_c0_g1_i1.p1  ORF type:complete len:140 (-),score=40.57 TRINITY_DN771_c0_g1_i1:118-537(-)
MRVTALIAFALIFASAAAFIEKTRRGNFCKLIMKRLTILNEGYGDEKEITRLSNLYNKIECDKSFVPQETGWHEGQKRRCWRQDCMLCSNIEAYARCIPGPKEQCLKHSLCGDFGVNNSCEWIHSPAYYECVKNAKYLL